MIARLVGVVIRPAPTMAQVAAHPDWLLPWLAVLALWAVCAVPLLETDVGQQALVDEHVRRVEAFGGTIDEASYQALQERPPVSAYFASGGRLLLAPPVTFAVAIGLIVLARREGARVSLTQAMAVSVYASVPLVLGQLAAAPLQYVRESLSSPFNLAAVAPLADEGTWAAGLMGSVELFGLWWTGLLAVGLGALTGGRSRGHLVRLLLVYAGVAAVVSAIVAILGGS